MGMNNIPKWIQNCKLMKVSKGQVYDNRSCTCDVAKECPTCGMNVEVERQRIEEWREKHNVK